MRKPKVVCRDFIPDLTPRRLVKGDVVRDRHFPTALSVFSHVEGADLIFSEGDNRWLISCIKHGLDHADGAPIDVTGLEQS